MKKILLVCILGSVMLLSGCKGSAIKKAQDLISDGDYTAAIEALEQYADDETAAPLLKQARLAPYLFIGGLRKTRSARLP